MKRNEVAKPTSGYDTNALEATKPNIESLYHEILKIKENIEQQVTILEAHYKSKDWNLQMTLKMQRSSSYTEIVALTLEISSSNLLDWFSMFISSDIWGLKPKVSHLLAFYQDGE